MVQFFKEYKTISYVVVYFQLTVYFPHFHGCLKKATDRGLIWAYK